MLAWVYRRPGAYAVRRRRKVLVLNPGGSPLAAGTASFVSSGPGGISVSATDAAGGTAPYTYQWQRNSNGGSYSNLSGATSRSLSDTTAATAGVLYGFKLVYTDAVPSSATSNTVTAQVYAGGALTGGIRAAGGFMGVM